MWFFVVRSSGFISYGLHLPPQSCVNSWHPQNTVVKKFHYLTPCCLKNPFLFLFLWAWFLLTWSKCWNPQWVKPQEQATLVLGSVHCNGVASRYQANNTLLHTHSENLKKGKHILLKSIMSEGMRQGFDLRNCLKWEILMSLFESVQCSTFFVITWLQGCPRWSQKATVVIWNLCELRSFHRSPC